MEISNYLLTIEEVSQIFKKCRMTIKRWEKDGKIKPIRINERGDRRYRRIDIENLKNES